MSIARGVVSSWQAIGARPIKVNATEPIAMVLVSDEVDANELHYFDSLPKALSYFMNGRSFEDIKKLQSKGNLFKYLVWANNKYEIIVPTIVSVAKWDKDAKKLKTNIIKAIADLKKVPAMYKVRPDIIAVADYTTDIEIAKQLVATTHLLRARTFVD